MSSIYLLNDDKYEGVTNLPMIKINFFDKKIDFSLYDALIFTSKNAVRAAEKIDKRWREKEIYSIGQGTSKEVQKYDVNLAHTAKNSYGNLFASEIKDMLKEKKVLFLRAKKVTSKLNQILLESGIDLKEEIVYETTCRVYKQDKPSFDDAVVIFTSPSTIKCFFKNFNWNSTCRAVCIGKVTAKAMPANIRYNTSKKQTIQSCIELAKNIVLSIIDL